MRALVYTGTMQTEMRDVPVSQPEEGQCTVAVSHCGICGSDMHAWHGHDPRRVPPLVLGHEATGVALDGKFKGKRVVINPLMTCEACKFCQAGNEHLCPERELIGMRLPGAFAERVLINEKNLTEIPDSLTGDEAALAEPLAVAVHSVRVAVNHLKNADPGMPIAVLGGGAIGLLCAMVLGHHGFTNVSIAETNPLRRQLLEDVTGAIAYDPLHGGLAEGSVTLVLDAVGSGITRKSSSEMVQPGGLIAHVGLQDNEPGLDTRRLTLQEIGFIGTYCYTNDDFAEAVNMLISGAITRQGWSEIRPLEDGVAGFEDIHSGKALPKIILEI